MAANATTHTAEEWEKLLEDAGLQDIVVHTSAIAAQDELRGLLRRFGCGGILQMAGRMLSLFLRYPEYRSFAREIRKGGVLPQNAMVSIGCGLYIGRKP
jgi:hypothetical protein